MRILNKSKRIEAYLKAEKKKYDQFKEEPKLLILGTSDSGKSTFLKQLKILHGKGFTPEEFKVAKQNAISNILTISEQILLKCEQEIQEEYSSLLGFISNVDGPYDGLPLQLINSIKTLWNSEQFQNIYISSQYDYPLTSPHFFNEISRIADPESTMTNNDVLLLRTVTQSISDSVFEISGFKVHFYDVSGLKHHRKHWIPYFDDVNCVVFVVNIAAFDQPMAEDPSKNQMEDAISLFNRICNNPLLIKSQMMLFFNKKDVYAEKVKRINISTFFPDYQGKFTNQIIYVLGKPQSYSEGIEFFKSKFISLNKTPRNFLIHTTCCTDTNAMNAIASSLL
ncbi:guanine nucleotide binding protein, alpha subunit [Globomyces pollinis-pini]|nr:guanine nucleotide binding protein, alpha subunit [Globomyces pollinis-pini]